jgi:hypothetical protein
MPGCCGDTSKDKPRMLLVSDCGAVAVDSQNMEIDIDDYIAFIRPIEHLLDFHISLDVIGDGKKSYENWLYMLGEGLTPVPVYHYGTPKKYLYEYCHRTDYVAISLGKADNRRLSVSKRSEMLASIWRSRNLVDSTGYPKVRVHGLGITALELVAAFNWYSVDSSSWVRYGGEFGVCLIPMNSSTGYALDQPPLRVSVTSRSSHRKNHIDNLGQPLRSQVREYVEWRGFRLGKGEDGDDDYEQGLRNSEPMRNQLNAIYYAEMGLALGKRVYIAGGFTTIADIEIERQIQRAVYSLGSDYYRMISFADYPKIQTVINLKKEDIHAAKSRSAKTEAKNPAT